MSGVIYLIACDQTGKAYVGSATTPRVRKAAHLYLLRRGRHHSIHLQRAYDRYGEEAFAFQIVEQVPDTLFLLAREQFWIWRWQGRLYNHGVVAGGPFGMKHSPAFKAACAERMKGNTLRAGSQMPAHARAEISASLIGNTNRRGLPHSSQDRRKISKGLKRAYAEGRRGKHGAVVP